MAPMTDALKWLEAQAASSPQAADAADELRLAREVLREIEERHGCGWCRDRARAARLGECHEH